MSPIWRHNRIFKKGHPTGLSSQLLLDIGNIIRPVNCSNLSPLSCFICYKTSSLLRSNALWNTMMAKNRFCKPPNGGFGVSIMDKEGKFVSTTNVYSSESEALPPLWWEYNHIVYDYQPCNQPATRLHLLVPSGSGGIIWGPQCYSLHSADQPWWMLVHVARKMGDQRKRLADINHMSHPWWAFSHGTTLSTCCAHLGRPVSILLPCH